MVNGAVARRPAILVVDADLDWCGALEHALGPLGIGCRRASSHAEALEALDIPAASADGLLDEVRKDQENLAGFLTVR